MLFSRLPLLAAVLIPCWCSFVSQSQRVNKSFRELVMFWCWTRVIPQQQVSWQSILNEHVHDQNKHVDSLRVPGFPVFLRAFREFGFRFFWANYLGVSIFVSALATQWCVRCLQMREMVCIASVGSSFGCHHHVFKEQCMTVWQSISKLLYHIWKLWKIDFKIVDTPKMVIWWGTWW